MRNSKHNTRRFLSSLAPERPPPREGARQAQPFIRYRELRAERWEAARSCRLQATPVETRGPSPRGDREAGDAAARDEGRSTGGRCAGSHDGFDDGVQRDK
jgi:hypothetical protein